MEVRNEDSGQGAFNIEIKVIEDKLFPGTESETS